MKNRLRYLLAMILLRGLSSGYSKKHLVDDMLEEYEFFKAERGENLSTGWLFKEVFKAIPYMLLHKFYWGTTMIKNYFKIALRNLLKQKAYSVLTIVGLSIGFGLFFLFTALSYVDLTADSFHKNADRLFSAVQVIKSEDDSKRQTALMPEPFGKSVKEDCPEVKDVCRFYFCGRVTLSNRKESFYETDLLVADKNFLTTFDFKLLQGDRDKLLSDPFSIVLTEEKAVKYFGDENPIGKTLVLNNDINLVVTGVVEDEPLNSTINYEFILPFEIGRNLETWMDDWRSNSVATYLLLKDDADISSVEEKMSELIAKHFGDDTDKPESIYFIPLKEMYLNTIEIETLQDKHFAIVAVIFFLSGITILIIVGVNYVSLSTSRFMTRGKEIGLRKVMGANRAGLIKQFLTESVIVAFGALPLGVIIYLGVSNYLSSEWSEIANYSMWQNPLSIIAVFAMVIMVGILAGIYPAVFLSSFEAVKVLKGTFLSVKKGSLFKKSLLTLQFVLAITLIIFSIALNRQFQHILTTDMGYVKDNVLTVRINDEQKPQLNLYMEELRKHSSVVNISAASGLPGQWDFQEEVDIEGIGKNDKWTINHYAVDYNFIELYDMKISMGRTFREEYDDKWSAIINKTAAERFGWENPIGKMISIKGEEYHVIGMIEDYSFKDVHFPVIPSVMTLDEYERNYVMAKINSPANMNEAKTFAKVQWKAMFPEIPFEGNTHVGYIQEVYKGINTIAQLAGGVGIVGILLAIMGILGLTAYHVERKTKEIGVRKVLGATETGIVKLLSKEFMILILISNVIGLPLGYIMTESFFQWGFVYRIPVGLDIPVLVFLGSMVFTFLTVASQVFKAARANPIDSIKCE